MILQPATGEWNMILTWDMKEGIQELNREVRRDEVKWMTAMNEIAGSADKAKAILDEWSSLVLEAQVIYAGSCKQHKSSLSDN